MKNNIPIPPVLLKNPVHFLSLGFGSGLMPKAPGTFGTLAAIPVYLLMANLSVLVYSIVTVALFVVGIYLCQKTTDELKVHDHSGIVFDEIVGFLITMIALPVTWQWIIAGFILFRLFDILKPWPISWLDKKVHGGLGIMLDDVLAGVFALVIMQLILYFNLGM
ncbi:MAG: phosphatidylglycerophosphatase A [Gammaproteobacteria bacterium]|nr:phosphatidylglycerophosphatase A [Gammaproteobacteria bacterium]MCW8911651.1 phosphatidylglycerophosphatase A [Gammaproteobacteria bacterium]